MIHDDWPKRLSPLHYWGGGGVKNTSCCSEIRHLHKSFIRLVCWRQSSLHHAVSTFCTMWSCSEPIAHLHLNTLETWRANVVSVTCGHKEPTCEVFCLVGNHGFQAFGFLFPCVDLDLPLGPYLCVTRCEEAVSIVTAAFYSAVGVWITRARSRSNTVRTSLTSPKRKKQFFRFQERLLTARIALAWNSRQDPH